VHVTHGLSDMHAGGNCGVDGVVCKHFGIQLKPGHVAALELCFGMVARPSFVVQCAGVRCPLPL
jgi:hypothetical protein